MAGFHEYVDNIVFLGSDPESMQYYSILPNCHLAVQLTLKHLQVNGHQLITYLGGVSTFGDHKELTIDPRFYYYRASQANRDNYNPSLVLDCGMNTESDYAAMRNLLEMHGRPSEAMFITSDSIAPGAMMALRERGLRIPEDISIATSNNTVLLKHSDPPLTSIELFVCGSVRIAAFCIQLLWQGSVRDKRVVIPYELVSREGVAPAPIDSPPSEL